MSDRLGHKPCWKIEVRSGQAQHFPNCSAEVGDSGALIVRKPIDPDDHWAISLVLGPTAWTLVWPCEGKGDGHDF